jgi:hypothetical protein
VDSEVERHFFDEPTSGTTGQIEALPLYGGQGAAMVHQQAPGADIVENLINDAHDAFRKAESYYDVQASDGTPTVPD